MVYENLENIALTWYQMPDEADRRDRLLRVIGYVLAVRAGCLEKAVGLHDHKGTLTVTWHNKPYEADTSAFALAWEGQGETAETVEHVVERRIRPRRCLGAGDRLHSLIWPAGTHPPSPEVAT